ncbi:hypothetical protein E6H33_07220 [Candidatus Bathyarchaeota archaeon]|nr:MAG: hypothetical protein E6H33_07220 [Candidatus Bathyarchaeota archaeon]
MTLKWSRLRSLLLVTGVSSMVFFVLAEDFTGVAVPNLETTLSVGFALSLVAFLLIASVELGKKALRDARRIYYQKVTRLPEASLRQVRRLHSLHYQAVHPDSWKWNQKWRKLWVLTAVPSVLLFVLAIYVVLSGDYLGFGIIALAMVPLLTLTLLRSLKLGQFRKEWMAQRKEILTAG